MSHCEITDTFIRDGFFVVEAEHFDDGGSFLYMEHYRWLVGEGNKQKRAVDGTGALLMDNGLPAPTRDRGDGNPRVPFLPPGRFYALRPGPHMDDSTIWEVLMSDHLRNTRHLGYRNQLTNENKVQTADQIEGGRKLVLRFQNVVGDTVVV